MEKANPLLDFLEESYPGMKANVARCEKLGFPWASRAFVKKEKGEIISHVGFLVYPILIEGEWHKAGAFDKHFSGYLMVHGNLPILDPFMIPPLSRC